MLLKKTLKNCAAEPQTNNTFVDGGEMSNKSKRPDHLGWKAVIRYVLVLVFGANTSIMFSSVRLPGAGTDFLPFEQDVAIPTVDVDFKDMVVGDKIYRSGGYPLYHTLYDGYHFTTMMDPGFHKSRAACALLLEIARDIVDSPILPMDVRDYAKGVDNFVQTLFGREKERFSMHNITSDGIESASRNFTIAANRFHTLTENVDKENPIAVRAINDKIMLLDKAFQIYDGLPDRKEYKHVLLSPSRANYYSTTTFPGMADLLYQIEDDATRWEQVRKHLSVLTYCIQSAAKILLT